VERQLQNLIRTDFNRLLARERLDCSAAVEKLIFVQSVEGHAHNGHGEFRQRRFVDVTIADVVRAVGLDAAAAKRARQKLIDDIFAWAERAIADDAPAELVDDEGRPLLTVPLLKGFEVNARGVLHGLYVGGLRDDSEVRAAVEDERRIAIGGGECYIIDTVVMRKMGLDAEALAHGAHAAELERYREEGLIVELAAAEVDDDRYRYFYIRHRVGPGHSDDAAVVFAARLWGRGCGLGVFLADAIDTLEKYAEKYADQDGELSRRIAASALFEPSWERDLKDLVYLAAVPEDDNDEVPDSSLRYFLRIDAEAGRCALQNHLDFIAGGATAPMLLGFDRVLSTRFYRWVHKRLAAYEGERAEEAAPVLETMAGVVERNFLTVSVDDSPAKVAEAFATSSAEVAVVVDGDGRVVGTIRAADILRFLWGRRR